MYILFEFSLLRNCKDCVRWEYYKWFYNWVDPTVKLKKKKFENIPLPLGKFIPVARRFEQLFISQVAQALHVRSYSILNLYVNVPWPS